MSDATINRFLARGTTAQRTAFTPSAPTPSSGPSQGYLWWDTDLQAEYAYDFGLAAWVVTGGGTGTVTHTGALTANAVLVGNGTADIKVGLAAANSKLLGSGASGSGAAYAELTLGTNLSMSGTTLNASGGSGTVLPNTCAGRLTLTTLVPVTTSNVTGATTVYFTPYLGNHISLYTSSTWTDYSFSEINVALGTLTSATNYDVFAYDVAAAVTLKIGPAWSSDTSRGSGAGTTELTLQDGVYVNANSITSGPGAKAGRYLGTFRTTATTTTEDSASKRFLWNNQNSVRRAMAVVESTASWNYTTLTYRQANGSTANQLAYVAGDPAVCVEATVQASFTSNNANAGVAVGVDSTTTPSGIFTFTAVTASSVSAAIGNYRGTPGLGYHFLAWLEISVASGTTTWYGTASLTYLQSGIVGSVSG